jgi:hypothetical protein
LPDAAAKNDSAPDTGAEGVHEERVDGVGAACAEKKFAVGGETGVVSYLDGAAEAALDFSAKIQAIKAWEIGELMQDAGG